MKKIVLIILLGIGLWCACTEEKPGYYRGGTGLNFYYDQIGPYDSNPYFGEGIDGRDSMTYVSSVKERDTLWFRIMVYGEKLTEERGFSLKQSVLSHLDSTAYINDSTTVAVEGVNFVNVANEYQVLKAGTKYTDISITVMNSAVLEDKELQIGFRLLPTEDLCLACPVWQDLDGMLDNALGLEQFDGAFHLIRLNDFMTRPDGWVGLPTPDEAVEGDQERGVLGIFSREKFEYIQSVIPEITYEDFESSETMPTVRAQAIGNLVAASLQEAYDSGNPVLEADGRLMWVNGVSWYSYWEVPYVPGN